MGGAGCGKTYQLMRALGSHLAAVPLGEGQKVLALTFMHGSRRRLEDRLGQLQALKNRSECATLDSFAWRLVRRWLVLATDLGHANIEPDQYERVCDAAGDLLQVKEVRDWVAAAYPVLVVDEAQDFAANRLRLIEGLAARLEVFVAADEFQCLDQLLRPNPACSWLADVCTSEELTQPRRTSVTELLDAAAAIRSGLPPTSGKLFKIQLTPKAPLAGAWVAGNLQWYGFGKSVAIITPALGSFAKGVLAWTAGNTTSKGAGPYCIPWEESEAKAASNFISGVKFEANNDIRSVVELLTVAGDPRTTRDISDWMDLQRRARAKSTFTKAEIEKAIEQAFAQRRRIRKGDGGGWRGMTVHGAKNREFDNVIVLWPAAITGSDDQKRRLLYNAVTRAKARCLVLVQTKAALNQAPFV